MLEIHLWPTRLLLDSKKRKKNLFVYIVYNYVNRLYTILNCFYQITTQLNSFQQNMGRKKQKEKLTFIFSIKMKNSKLKILFEKLIALLCFQQLFFFFFFFLFKNTYFETAFSCFENYKREKIKQKRKDENLFFF